MTVAPTSNADLLHETCARGSALHAAGRFSEALAAFDAALAIDPRRGEAHLGRGQALRQMRRYEEAVLSYDRALAISPGLVAAFNNRALALQDMQQFEAALEGFDRALRIAPDNAEIRFNRGYLLLLLGRFAEGWPEYEWRRKRANAEHKPWARPEWRGEDIAGKRILLHCEQGFGDTLQFARFARLVEERGAQVILAAQRSLGALLRRLDCTATIVQPGETLPEFDL
ncbi:MAG TPA: tetratricopeptide repeat protein, partial [Stellaceae bacterium]|nr:tetratricopeptide repeat protein [Stellaceae bacterium]